MAINFPSNPSNSDTFDAANVTFVYNSTKNTWTPQNPVDTVASQVTTYATIDDLPLSNQTSGAQAFVSSTNRLYIWNGNGWYNIALINTTPSISGVNSSYDLASDGTATVVTITATDPEGIPITYSIASDTSGSIATVTQGTGANTNVFTITPSTNSANAGTFSLTFRASDGVNIATAAASFTLVFTVINSNYTTALITSVGANLADNNNFVDASPSSTTLTAYQDAHMTSFSPYRQGGYSTYFDGTGDYISTPSGTTSLELDGDFTIEWWMHPITMTLQGIHATSATGFNNNATTTVLNHSTAINKLSFWSHNILGNAYMLTSDTISLNVWTHIAIVRSGSTFTLYQNGVSKSTYTSSGTVYLSTSTLGHEIGRYWNADYNGYLTDFRVVKGTAVYTSAFAPLTQRLTAVTNTSLLACHLPYIADGSTNGHAITVTGDVATRPFSPYDVDQYDTATDGGSIRITSSGDYVGFQNGTDFEFDGDFTVACWVYFESETGHNSIFSISDAGNDGFCQMGSDRLLLRNTSGLTTIIDSSAYQIPANRWTHVALTRSGSDIKFFLNGVITLTATSSVTISEDISVEGTIGRRLNSANIGYFFGNIADLYVKKGTADYTAAFTPPLTPASSTGTVLHVKGTDASIIDKSQSVKAVILNGDVKSSTTQTKYLSSSMYFDGTGDWISLPASTGLDLGTGDLTVEAWLYQTIAPADYQMIVSRTDANGYICIRGGGTGGQVEITGDVLIQLSLNNSISTNTWYHFAATRSSGTWNVFINGTSIGTASGGNAWNIGGNGSYIGRWGGGTDYAWPGYMSDLRITKGLARYTSNFTPPTAALRG